MDSLYPTPARSSPITSLFRKIRSYNKRKFLPLLILIIIVAAIAFLIRGLYQPASFSAGSNLADTRYQAPGPKKNKQLNNEFAFPLKDDKGKEVSKIKYILQSAELRDEIIVQGKKATSIKGRTFLIINLKLVNNFDKTIEINTKDYIRLIINNNEAEALAPDIHNDPVSVQAISTKYTRVGFPIDDTYQNLKFKVGEINGAKETVDINF